MTYTFKLAKRLATAHDTIMIVLLAALASCSQGGDLKEGLAPPDPPSLTGVTVSPNPAVIGAGQTQIFSALGNMSDGSTSPVAAGCSVTGASPFPTTKLERGSKSGSLTSRRASPSDGGADPRWPSTSS